MGIREVVDKISLQKNPNNKKIKFTYVENFSILEFKIVTSVIIKNELIYIRNLLTFHNFTPVCFEDFNSRILLLRFLFRYGL
jgi:hypothetical protein